MSRVLEVLSTLSRAVGNRLRQSRDTAFWSIVFASIIIFVILGFFLHGGTHGLYMDDYTEKLWAFDLGHLAWKLNLIPEFHIRPLAHVLIANLSNAIPKYEFLLRIIIAAIHLLNTFLIGKLAYRLSHSHLIGLVAGAFFLFPIFANEALLWFAASIANTISLTLLLIGFHCFLSCRSLSQDLGLFSGGVGAWILMVLFYESGLFTLLLLPLILAAGYRDNIRQHARLWIPALCASYIPIGVYLFLVERADPSVTSRGGPTLNLSFILRRRIPDVSENFWWLVTDRGRLPGHRFASVSGPLREALRLGWHEWLSVPWGPLIIAIAIIGLCLIALLFTPESDAAPSFVPVLRIAVIGCGWLVLSLMPLILVKSQIVEIRTLYAPSAGIAIAGAALLGMVVQFASRSSLLAPRLVILLSGFIVLLTALAMAGVTRAYELRWDLDQRQLAALSEIIFKLPRSQPLWLLPIGVDERSLDLDPGRNAALEAYVYGVFEIPWSARDAVRLMSGKPEIEAVVGNRWVKPLVSSVQYSNDGRPKEIVVQGRTVPIQQLLAFTYQEGRAILLSPLDLDSPAGKAIVVINLPLVEKFGTAGVEIRSYHLQLEQMN